MNFHLALITLGACSPVILFAAIAAERWGYWRSEYDRLRRYHLKVLEQAQVQFIQPIDMRGIGEALAEVDRVRAELTGETCCGTLAHRSNVIPVDFSGGDHAA